MIRIEISTGNAAFEESPGGEVARILHDLADRFAREVRPQKGQFMAAAIGLRDVNGNAVGTAEITEN